MALCSWKPTWVCWEWANVWCQDGFWRCVRELKLFDCVCKGFQKALLGILGHGNRVGVTFGVLRNGESRDSNRGRAETQSFRHRFSAFWLRSKCSICSYQLNIWYVDHVSTSILIWFFQGEWLSEACFGSFTSWPGIAVPPGSAHFPIIQPIKAIQAKGKQTAEARGRSWTIVCCLVPVCKGLVHLADTRGLHRAGKENVGQWGLFSNRRVDPSPTNCGLNFSPYLSREWFWGQKLCSIMIWEAKGEESVVCSKAMYLRVCHGGPKKTDDKHTYLA